MSARDDGMPSRADRVPGLGDGLPGRGDRVSVIGDRMSDRSDGVPAGPADRVSGCEYGVSGATYDLPAHSDRMYGKPADRVSCADNELPAPDTLPVDESSQHPVSTGRIDVLSRSGGNDGVPNV